MQVRTGINPITLSAPNVLFVGLFVLLVFPVAMGFIFFDSWYAIYLSRFVGPEFESSLGFHGSYAQIQTPNGIYEIYALTQVDPNGVLGRAGVRVGDVPCRFHHGVESGFLGRLHHSRGQRIELTFCRPPEMAEQRVTIQVPGGDG